MRKLEAFKLYSSLDTGFIATSKNHVIMLLVEGMPSGYSYIPKFRFGPGIRIVYVPKSVKLRGRTVTANIRAARDMIMGGGSSIYIVAQTAPKETSFVMDLTTNFAYLHKQCVSLKYVDVSLEFLSSTVNRLKSINPSLSTSLVYVMDTSTLQPNTVDKELYGYFIIRALLDKQKTNGLPVDRVFLTSLQDKDTSFRLIYHREVEPLGNYNRVKGMIMNVKPDLVFTDDPINYLTQTAKNAVVSMLASKTEPVDSKTEPVDSKKTTSAQQKIEAERKNTLMSATYVPTDVAADILVKNTTSGKRASLDTETVSTLGKKIVAQSKQHMVATTKPQGARSTKKVRAVMPETKSDTQVQSVVAKTDKLITKQPHIRKEIAPEEQKSIKDMPFLHDPDSLRFQKDSINEDSARLIASYVAHILPPSMASTKETQTTFERDFYKALCHMPDDAVTAYQLYIEKDSMRLIVHATDMIKKYHNKIYPSDIKVDEKVLERMDKWSEDHHLVGAASVDPILTKDVLDKYVATNLHRVMAQKQLTWENMSKQIEHGCSRVLADAGFTLLSCVIEDKPADPRHIEPSYMSEIKLRIKNNTTKQIKTLKYVIPTLFEGKYHIQGGIKWLFPAIIATMPIFTIKPGKVQFKTNYAAMTFDYGVHFKKQSLFVYIGGMKIPIILLMMQFKSLNALFDEHGISSQIVDTKRQIPDKCPYVIRLPDGKFLVITNIRADTYAFASILLNGLQLTINALSDGDSIDMDAPEYGKMLMRYTKYDNAPYIISKIKRYMVDTNAAELLKARGINADLYNIITICSNLAINEIKEDKMGIKNIVIRLMDLIPAEVEKALHYSVTEYKRRSKIDPSIELVTNEGWVINSLREHTALLPYKDGNPSIESAHATAVRIVGPGGFNKIDSVQIKDRNIVPSHFGQLDPMDTAEGNPGIQLYMSAGFEYDPEHRIFTEIEPNDASVNMFGSTAGQIPFVSCNDGNRVMFGCSQCRQVVPINESEPPLCMTGMETCLPNYASTTFTKKAKDDGVAEYVDENVIIVKYKNGTTEAMNIRPSELQTGSGKHSALTHTPTVKTGDNITAGQHLITNQFIKPFYASGKNVLACYKPHDGFTFEDGIIVSQTFAKQYVSVHYEEIDVLVDSPTEIKEFPTMKFERDGHLRYAEGERIVVTMANMFGGYQEHVVAAPTACTVVDIEVFPANESFVPLVDFTTNMFYKATNDALKQRNLPLQRDSKRYTENVGKFEFRKKRLIKTLIRIKLVEKRSISEGDKLNNRHGNKGVITAIYDDDKMPKLPDGRIINIIFNPLGVISRMNLGQLYEIHVGNVIMATVAKIKQLPDNEARDLLCKVYTLIDGYTDKRLSSDLCARLRSFSGAQLKDAMDYIRTHGFRMIYPPFRVPDIKQIQEAAKLVGTELESKLMIPGVGYTATPVTWGYLFVNKLEHMSDIKRKTRSVGPYMNTTLEPKRGGKTGGLRLGEMDVYSFLAYDAKTLLRDFFMVNGDNPTLKNKVLYDIMDKGEASIEDLVDTKDTQNNVGAKFAFDMYMTVCGLKV